MGMSVVGTGAKLILTDNAGACSALTYQNGGIIGLGPASSTSQDSLVTMLSSQEAIGEAVSSTWTVVDA